MHFRNLHNLVKQASTRWWEIKFQIHYWMEYEIPYRIERMQEDFEKTVGFAKRFCAVKHNVHNNAVTVIIFFIYFLFVGL